jgi:serine/threonine protein kinase
MYKAPEIFNPKIPIAEKYTTAVDIYSFGILANELMAGEIPWDGLNKTDIEVYVGGDRP